MHAANKLADGNVQVLQIAVRVAGGQQEMIRQKLEVDGVIDSAQTMQFHALVVVNTRVSLLRGGEHGLVVQEGDVVDGLVDA